MLKTRLDTHISLSTWWISKSIWIDHNTISLSGSIYSLVKISLLQKVVLVHESLLSKTICRHFFLQKGVLVINGLTFKIFSEGLQRWMSSQHWCASSTFVRVSFKIAAFYLMQAKSLLWRLTPFFSHFPDYLN